MKADRFVPQVEEVEGRLTPAGLNATGLNLTPEIVFGAAALTEQYFNGTRGALEDQTFIRQPGNRAAVQALNAIQIAQAPILNIQLAGYAAELRAEQAADPSRAEFLAPFVERYDRLAAQALQAGAQAQAITDRINGFNAADAARAAAAGGTGGTNGTGTNGTISTGVNGVNGVGVRTGTNNTLPNTGGSSPGAIILPNTGVTGTGTTTGIPGTTTDSTIGNTGGTTTGTPTGTAAGGV